MLRGLKPSSCKVVTTAAEQINNLPRRGRLIHIIFGEWLNNVFNKVDPSRIESVGPDIACAEWLLRNGGRVRFQSSENFRSDYNQLPRNKSTYKIEEIDATDSSVSSVGFAHLRNLSHVKKVTLRQCRYVGDRALAQLTNHLAGTLKDLEIENCVNITDAGIKCLVNLSQLRRLYIANLPGLQDQEGSTILLHRALPKCAIDFRFY